jgi:transcriptional regulator with XRE-family HTH domain
MKSKLRITRVIRGLNQKDLEKRTGIIQSRISLIEHGYLEPNEERKKLAKALRVQVGDIWPKPVKGDSLLTKGIL